MFSLESNNSFPLYDPMAEAEWIVNRAFQNHYIEEGQTDEGVKAILALVSKVYNFSEGYSPEEEETALNEILQLHALGALPMGIKNRPDQIDNLQLTFHRRRVKNYPRRYTREQFYLSVGWLRNRLEQGNLNTLDELEIRQMLKIFAPSSFNIFHLLLKLLEKK